MCIVHLYSLVKYNSRSFCGLPLFNKKSYRKYILPHETCLFWHRDRWINPNKVAYDRMCFEALISSQLKRHIFHLVERDLQEVPTYSHWLEHDRLVRVLNWALCHEDIWGSGSTAPPFLTSALDGGAWSASSSCHSPLGTDTLPPGKKGTRNPLFTELGEPQVRSGRYEEKISCSAGKRTTILPSSSL
jgi:hypothetical protein